MWGKFLMAVLLEIKCGPDHCGPVGWSIVLGPKGCSFDPQSGHVRTWIAGLIPGMCTKGR